MKTSKFILARNEANKELIPVLIRTFVESKVVYLKNSSSRLLNPSHHVHCPLGTTVTEPETSCSCTIK